MQCPNYNVTLTIADRQGVEIDYCPQCRGVWLDRGELDKIIERTSREPSARSASTDTARHEHHGGDRDRHHGKHRKKSLLKELFDF